MKTCLVKEEFLLSPQIAIWPAKQTVCLLGFMGAGKTTVAIALAELLGAAWVDLDEFIEAREGRPIAKIIENLGEPVFRELEADALQEILETFPSGQQSFVIALGGGAWTNPFNQNLVQQHNCRTVWLDVPFELCWQRICESNVDRPLARNKEQALNLFNARQKIYQNAELRVKLTKEQNVQEIAAQIHHLFS